MSCCLIPFINATNCFLEAASLSFLIFFFYSFFPVASRQDFLNMSVNRNYTPVSEFHLSIWGTFCHCSPTNTEQCQVSWCQGLLRVWVARSGRCSPWGLARVKPGRHGPSHPQPGARCLGGIRAAPTSGSSLGTNQGWHQPVNLSTSCGLTSLM